MDLRAVPVRCLAMDKVAATIVPSLTAEQQQQYAKRKQDGQGTADKVNKMFWYLAPTALPSPNSQQALPLQPPAHSMASACMPLSAAPDFPGNGLNSAALSLDPTTSNGLQSMATALHNSQQQQQFMSPLLQLGCMPSAAAAALPPHMQGAAGAPLLQLAVAAQQMAAAQQAAHMHQLAQVQQQLSAASLNPACRPLQHAAAAAAAAGLPPYMSGRSDVPAYLGLVSQPQLAVPGYQDLQHLSSMMGSMCQV
ncbi:hypothetical protein OEZ86_000501 [Tetradesmus obliquus]|nr:hypothetical protein OEZ86_000501 [Tetradesmus obliquus]